MSVIALDDDDLTAERRPEASASSSFSSTHDDQPIADAASGSALVDNPSSEEKEKPAPAVAMAVESPSTSALSSNDGGVREVAAVPIDNGLAPPAPPPADVSVQSVVHDAAEAGQLYREYNDDKTGAVYYQNVKTGDVAWVLPKDALVLREKKGTGKEVANMPDDGEEGDGDEEEEEGPKVPFCTLFRYADGLDWFLMLFGGLMAVAHGVLQPLFAVVFGEVINGFGGDGVVDAIRSVLYWFLILGGISFVTGFFQVFCWMFSAQRQISRIRKAYFNSLLRQELGWMDGQESGALTARIAGDMIKIQEGMGDKVSGIFQYLAMFVAGFAVAATISWRMTLVVLTVVPLLAISGGIMAKFIADMATAGQAAYAKAGGVAEEVISSMRTVQAFGGEEREAARFEVSVEEAMKTGIKGGHINGISMGVTMLIMFSAYAIGFGYGAARVRAGAIEAGDVISTFFSIIIGSFALGQGAPNFAAVAKAKGAAYEVFGVIDRVSEIDPLDPSGEKPENGLQGHVEFVGVDFTYPTRPEDPVIHNLNLDVPVGSTVAFVGPSGSGKSSTVRLLTRFYDPNAGSVLIDGRNVNQYNVQWLRKQIGVVSQEPVLFAKTIAENIAFGNELDMDRVIQVARDANAYDFIMQFPDGFDTHVGERGSQMSGGQKQRVSIARALYRNPRLLILDEATSALDNRSEAIVQEALDKASSGRTTFVIAHRLSTVRHADLICVMQDGVLVDRGTHEELYAAGGLYRELVDLQALEGGDSDSEDAAEDPDALLPIADVTANEDEEAAGDEEEGGKIEVKAPVKRAIKMNKPETCYLIWGVVGSFLAGVVFPVFSIVFSEFITDMLTLTGDDLRERSIFWAMAFVVLGVITGIANYLLTAFFTLTGERLTFRLRMDLFKSYLGQSIGFFDDKKHATGILAAKLSGDAALVQHAAGGRIGVVIQSVATLGGGLVIAAIACWRLTLVVLGSAPFMMIGGAMQVKAMQTNNEGAQEAYESSSNIASECLSSMHTVAGLGVEAEFEAAYNAELAKPDKGRKVNAAVAGFGFGFGEAMGFLVFALAFWYGGVVVDKDQCAVNDMFTAVMAIVFGAMMAGQVSSFAPDYGKAKTAAIDIFRIVDTPAPIAAMEEQGDAMPECKGVIELENVRFTYPSRPDQEVLKGVSLRVQPGQTVALVGSSGSGKSTIIQLLERFYDPTDGAVMIDGRDMRDLNIHDLRSHIGLVSQEPILFGGSIIDNIRYGKTDATREEVERAARDANAHDFIMELPKGYDTDVGARGSQLSGGQKQRVAVARCLVRDPPIVLFDEATSALDSESERLVQEALDRAAEGRSVITIAHRLSTVANADVIVVMDQGEVVERGNHAELMANHGLYYDMVRSAAEGT